MAKLTKLRLGLLSIIILVIIAGLFDFSQLLGNAGFSLPQFMQRPFHLGLDLQGGTHLVYNADTSQIPPAERPDALAGVRDVIERRVNAFGVAEPVVQTTGSNDEWRVIVELAGVTDVNQAIQLIGETPLLEFKEPNPNPQISLTPEQQQELADFNTQVEKTAQDVLGQVSAAPDTFADLAKQYSQDPGSAVQGGDLGFFPRGAFVPEFEKACFDDLTVGQISGLIKTQFGYHIIKKVEEQGADETLQVRCSHILLSTRNENFYLDPNAQWIATELTGSELKTARVEFDQNTREPHVALEFNDRGSELFAQITKRNIGRPVAIFLDGQPISTPTVQQEITAGRAVITGQFTISESKLLAQRLNAGALPVPIELISQKTVGSTLGQSSLEKSLFAGMIGLLLVALFMIGFYRLPGLVSVIALIFYGIFVLAIFKLIPVTLTLAGITGFVLSLGMAVDANVLIFERLKEELRKGKPLELAVQEGFNRAWSSIFDGHISTLITSFILLTFSTSVVKGFAVTLSIGVIFSIFSAVVVCKIMMELLIRFRFARKSWLFGAPITK